MSEEIPDPHTTLAQIALPYGLSIRVWTDADFAAIERLSSAEG
jgi:hypothetical protein